MKIVFVFSAGAQANAFYPFPQPMPAPPCSTAAGVPKRGTSVGMRGTEVRKGGSRWIGAKKRKHECGKCLAYFPVNDVALFCGEVYADFEEFAFVGGVGFCVFLCFYLR